MPRPHRRHSTAFKRQAVEEYHAGSTLRALRKRHDIRRQLIRVWIEKHEAAAYDEDAETVDLIQERDARIAEKRAWIRDHRPEGVTVERGCDLMEVARSNFYAEPAPGRAGPMILAAITAICEEYPAYGYRRVGAELRHRGLVVNAKKVRRIMAENGPNPKRRRRYVVTTDSDYDGSIFSNIAKEFEARGPDQLSVADESGAHLGTSAKTPIAFFSTPRSMRVRSSSRFNRVIPEAWPAGDGRSEMIDSIDGEIPTSLATRVSGRPVNGGDKADRSAAQIQAIGRAPRSCPI